MMNLHFNTETSLVLLYCVATVSLLFVLSIPLPYRVKQPINALIEKSLYYFGIAAILPLWTLITAFRNLNRFSHEIADPQVQKLPFMGDKHKGRVIKMQRNLIMALFALVSYVLLFRFHKVVSRYDDLLNNKESIPIENDPKAGYSTKKIKSA